MHTPADLFGAIANDDGIDNTAVEFMDVLPLQVAMSGRWCEPHSSGLMKNSGSINDITYGPIEDCIVVNLLSEYLARTQVKLLFNDCNASCPGDNFVVDIVPPGSTDSGVDTEDEYVAADTTVA